MPQLTVNKVSALLALGSLLEYPGEDYLEKIKEAKISVAPVSRHAAKALDEFHAALSGQTIAALEEQYTRTFDIAPLCNPYASSYIYGDESYDRGTMMSTFERKFVEVGFDKGKELPDHLGVLLKFSAHLSPEELNELIAFCLLNPVKQMNEQLKDSESPFYNLLRAVLDVIKAGLPRELVHD